MHFCARACPIDSQRLSKTSPELPGPHLTPELPGPHLTPELPGPHLTPELPGDGPQGYIPQLPVSTGAELTG